MKRCPSMPWFSCTCRGVSRTKMKDCRKPRNMYESEVRVCSIHRTVHFKRGHVSRKDAENKRVCQNAFVFHRAAVGGVITRSQNEIVTAVGVCPL